jgi:hypothetical protein
MRRRRASKRAHNPIGIDWHPMRLDLIADIDRWRCFDLSATTRPERCEESDMVIGDIVVGDTG